MRGGLRCGALDEQMPKVRLPEMRFAVQGMTANGEKSGANGRIFGVNAERVGETREIREIYGLWAGSEWEGRVSARG
jgi:hypothetical protein